MIELKGSYVMKYIVHCVLILTGLVLVCCNKEAPKVSDLINAARRNVSPRTVDLAGIKFYQTREEVKNRLPFLRCETKDNNIDVCRWKTNNDDRRGEFKGIDQIKLTFYRDTLQTIEVRYSEMFDVEYADFDRSVREKYGYTIVGKLIDSTGNEWQYDSLKVSLFPNKKQHWTGSAFVFTPVLDFQERAIYRRWLNEMEQRKPQTLY